MQPKFIKNLDFIKPGMKVLDLGCGSGYLTFPIAQRSEKAYVVGLDIVTDTLERNAVKAQEMDIKNLEFISYDGITFPFCLKLLCLMAETTIVCFAGEVG